MKNLFDTHCHPNLNSVKDKNEVIENFFEKWWKYINIIWTNSKKNKDVLKLSSQYKNVYVSLWIHPSDVYNLDVNETISELVQLIINNKEKVIWVWEIWLDYHWFEDDVEFKNISYEQKEKIINNMKDKQKIFFIAQIELAKKLNLPVIIHNRDSKDDLIEILEKTWCKNFIFHCFTENLEYAKRLIKLSPECKISFSWIVSFKNAKDIQEVAKNIPLKHILAETDAPYLTPSPLRWKEENEPLYTKYVIDAINNLRWEDCSEQIFENSLEAFWIKK